MMGKSKLIAGEHKMRTKNVQKYLKNKRGKRQLTNDCRRLAEVAKMGKYGWMKLANDWMDELVGTPTD
jgi:hypothetical protein